MNKFKKDDKVSVLVGKRPSMLKAWVRGHTGTVRGHSKSHYLIRFDNLAGGTGHIYLWFRTRDLIKEEQ
jgi:hypothetical protein